MIKNLKIALAAAAALGGVALSSGTASAMPVATPSVAPAHAQADVQNVRWVCGPFRCFWRPGFYGGYWGPRPFYGAYYGPRPYFGGYYAPRWHYWHHRW